MHYYLASLCFLLMDGFLIYLIFYTAISVCGLWLTPIYVSILLLDFVIRIHTLKNVIASVTTNIDQLILTSVLIFIVFFIFATIGFFYF